MKMDVSFPGHRRGTRYHQGDIATTSLTLNAKELMTLTSIMKGVLCSEKDR